jgi:hypothetical protein
MPDGLSPVASRPPDSYPHRAEGVLTVFFLKQAYEFLEEIAAEDPENA